MTSVLVSLLILTILPLACAWIGGYYRARQLGSVDNKEPRIQSLSLTGPGARAVAAQANCWEALGLYSAALLAVVISGVDLEQIATLAMVVAVLRIIYVPLYIMDNPQDRNDHRQCRNLLQVNAADHYRKQGCMYSPSASQQFASATSRRGMSDCMRGSLLSTPICLAR